MPYNCIVQQLHYCLAMLLSVPVLLYVMAMSLLTPPHDCSWIVVFPWCSVMCYLSNYQVINQYNHYFECISACLYRRLCIMHVQSTLGHMCSCFRVVCKPLELAMHMTGISVNGVACHSTRHGVSMYTYMYSSKWLAVSQVPKTILQGSVEDLYETCWLTTVKYQQRLEQVSTA